MRLTRSAASACAAILLVASAGRVFAAAADAPAEPVDAYGRGPAELVGAWVADDAQTRSVTRVTVRREGGEFFVRVWGRCHPPDCPWGQASGRLRDDVPKPELAILYQPGFARETMALRVVRPGLLAYRVDTTVTAGAGRGDYVSEGLLKRAPARHRRAARR